MVIKINIPCPLYANIKSGIGECLFCKYKQYSDGSSVNCSYLDKEVDNESTIYKT